MAKIQFDIRKTDGGQSDLLKDPNCVSGLWVDERESILARIGATKGRPEVGLKLYSVSYYSEKEWIIRCIEIVNSIDAREKSNITTSIKVKAQFNRKGKQILSIFEAINNDVKRQMPSPSSELLSLLDYSDTDAQWYSSEQNGKFGIKTFANPTELVDLLDNILQPDYHNYQAIYFIPIECKFHPDMNYVLLPNGIDKLVSKKFDSQEPIKGVIFRPEQSHITIFESQILQTKVKWLCDGYRTIEKSFANTTITPDEVYRKIDKNDYFSVIPSGTSIVCSLDGRKVNEENGSFYLRWDMLDKCEFVFSKVGYEQQNCKLPNVRQTIILSEKTSKILVKFCARNEQSEIPIDVLPSSLGDHSMDGMVLCTQNYFSSLKPANENTTNTQKFSLSIGRSRLVLLFCATLLVGGCLGGLIGWFSHTPKSLDEQGTSTSEESVTPVSREKKMENYLKQDTWSEGRDDYNNLEPPTGLYKAMNNFSYEDIERIYNQLNISKGRLEDVHKIIEEFGGSGTEKCKRPNANYSDKTGNCNIEISKWKELVREANKVQQTPNSSGGGSGGSPTSFKCQYCGTAFTSTAKCNQHENTCSKNPAKSGKVAD